MAKSKGVGVLFVCVEADFHLYIECSVLGNIRSLMVPRLGDNVVTGNGKVFLCFFRSTVCSHGNSVKMMPPHVATDSKCYSECARPADIDVRGNVNNCLGPWQIQQMRLHRELTQQIHIVLGDKPSTDDGTRVAPLLLFLGATLPLSEIVMHLLRLAMFAEIGAPCLHGDENNNIKKTFHSETCFQMFADLGFLGTVLV